MDRLKLLYFCLLFQTVRKQFTVLRSIHLAIHLQYKCQIQYHYRSVNTIPLEICNVLCFKGWLGTGLVALKFKYCGTVFTFDIRPLFALKWHLNADFGRGPFRISAGLNLSVPHCNSHKE